MRPFLSSNAQDFIEDTTNATRRRFHNKFLSSNAQDFIEDKPVRHPLHPITNS